MENYQPRILILDDELEMLSIMEDFVSYSLNLRVFVASSGNEGLKVCQSFTFDLIVCDFRMPDGDGLTFLQKYRELGGKAPIIFMSGESNVDIRGSIDEKDAVSILEKPFRMAELEQAIRQTLARSSATEAKKSKRSVLVVEDDENNRLLLQEILQEDFSPVLIASDGVEALQLMAQHSIQLVVSDIKMPGMDGIELLRRLRELKNPVPFIIVSAYRTQNFLEEAHQLGSLDFIEKPFQINTLLLAAKKASN